MTRTPDHIWQQLTQHRDTLRRLGVRRLALFGSAVRGEAAEGSDLDFLVKFNTKSFDAYMDLKVFLEDLLRCRIDLVLADAVKPRLRKAILEEAVDAPGL